MTTFKIIVMAILGLSAVESALAQSDRTAALEYLTASSPLKSGGQVTVYSTPGQGLATSITANTPNGAGLNSNQSNASPVAGGRSDTAAGNPGSVQPVSAPPAPANNPSAMGNLATGRPVAMATPPGNSLVLQSDPFVAGTTSRVVLPTLGVTPTSGRRPGWWNRPLFGGNQSLPPVSVPAANLPPQLSSGAPSLVLQQPPGAVPAPGGVIPPTIDYKNYPPGSYAGRGIFGQQECYVDGQPARNLFRFLTPW